MTALLHDHVAERRLLQATVIEPSHLADLADRIEPDDLTHPSAQRIWAGLRASWGRGDPLGLPGLEAAIPARSDRVWLLTEGEDPSEFIVIEPYWRDWAEQVEAASKRRRIASACHAILADLGDLNAVEKAAEQIREAFTGGGSGGRDMREVVAGIMEQIGDPSLCPVPGVPWPLRGMDDLVRLWPSRLVYIAALTGHGKSTLAGQTAVSAARTRGPVAFFSGEMTGEQIADRVLAAQCDIPATRIEAWRTGPGAPSDEQGIVTLCEAARAVSDLPIRFFEGSATLTTIRAECQRMRMGAGLGLVVVDYIQQMQMPAEASRALAVGLFSTGLKQIAMDLKVPVLACVQFNRAANDPKGKPKLHHLRDSGTLEQDADSVVILWRDEGRAELVVAKNRGGPTGRVTATARMDVARFEEGF